MTQMVTGQSAATPFGDDGATAGSPDPAPPPFGTTAWGYRRSEVDAWAVWVEKLVAHGRRETVRADSAEATLRATLDRLEQLERPDPVDRPRPAPEHPLPAAGLPRRTPGAAGMPPPAAADGSTGNAGPERLQVVETTLHEVMSLLHVLVERDGSRPPG